MFTVVALFALLGQQAQAQVLYGSIIGNVRDASDAAVPAAKVVIVHRETNQTREAATNEAGGYFFSTVPGGTYEVRVSKEGFQTATERDLIVQTNQIV
ncbi:MAG: carboxypeptidase-like regulatory domain-containing protein, partial [Bryobacteraceae bacterium]